MDRKFHGSSAKLPFLHLKKHQHMNAVRFIAFRGIVAVVLVITSSSSGLAASMAFDDAAQGVYDDGWQTGDNGGVGWGGGWIVDSGGFGQRVYFVGDSDANGGGVGPGIDTPTADGRSWAIRSSNSPQALGNATRAFDGTLAVGQSVHLALDNGSLAPGPADGVVGFGILSGANNMFEFIGSGVSNVYLISDQNGFRSTAVPVTISGVDIRFQLTAPTAYAVTISRRDGGGAEILTGTLASSGLDTLRVFNFRAGNANPADNAYFNSIAIVPEPCCVLLLVIGVAGLLAPRTARPAK